MSLSTFSSLTSFTFAMPAPTIDTPIPRAQTHSFFERSEENCSAIISNPEFIRAIVSNYFDKIETMTPNREFPFPGDGITKATYFINCLNNDTHCFFPTSDRYQTFSEEIYNPDNVRRAFDKLNTQFSLHGINRSFAEVHDPNKASLIWGRVENYEAPPGSAAFFTSDYFNLEGRLKYLIASTEPYPLTGPTALHEIDHWPLRGHPQAYREFVARPSEPTCFYPLEELAINIVQQSVCERSHLIYREYCTGFPYVIGDYFSVGDEDLTYWNISTQLDTTASLEDAKDRLFQHSMGITHQRLETLYATNSPTLSPTQIPSSLFEISIFDDLTMFVGGPIVAEFIKRGLYACTESPYSSYSISNSVQTIPFWYFMYSENKIPYDLSPLEFSVIFLITSAVNSGIAGDAIRQGLGNFALLFSVCAAYENQEPDLLLLGLGVTAAMLSVKALFQYCGESSEKDVDMQRLDFLESYCPTVSYYDKLIADNLQVRVWVNRVHQYFNESTPVSTDEPRVHEDLERGESNSEEVTLDAPNLEIIEI